MDDDRFERIKEMIGQIEPKKDFKERIFENIKYRKSIDIQM